MNDKKASSCKALFKKLPSIDELYISLDIENLYYPRDVIKKKLHQTLSAIRKDIQFRQNKTEHKTVLD